jgi:hypothetical protein
MLKSQSLLLFYTDLDVAGIDMKLTRIEMALKDGARMHGFLSGGGLRVVRIEKDGELKGYGEHPNVEEALSHANKDILYGGRPYKLVYGVLNPHYLTGSSTASSRLDGWLLKGNTFDSYAKRQSIITELRGYSYVDPPEDIIAKVEASRKPVEWSFRGYTYRTVYDTLGGEVCHSTKLLSPAKNGADPWMYGIMKRGKGNGFYESLEKAFGDKGVEEEDEDD